MYAIVQQGGHQYRVSPGDRLVVDRLEAEVGSFVALEPVLLLQGDAGDATVGSPVVDGARVAVLVVSHSRGRKIRVFKYKAKKRYRRTQGHRSYLTELRVEALLGAGEPLPEAPAAAAVEVPEVPTQAPEEPDEVTAVAAPAPKARSRRVAASKAVDEAAVDDEPAAEAAAKDPETEAEVDVTADAKAQDAKE